MRLFIGIQLPKTFQRELIRLQTLLKDTSRGGRFTPADNFHITLHFIGESGDLSGAALAVEEAVRGIRPFGLHLGRISGFARKEGYTAYVQVLGQLEELNALYESLQAALQEQGFPREQRAYVPHITLGRGVGLTAGDLTALGEIPANASMQVQEITLFESQRQGRGMVYLPLHRARI